MTSSSILPSIGPPPPEFRRPQVPENLRPQLAGGSSEPAVRRQTVSPEPAPETASAKPEVVRPEEARGDKPNERAEPLEARSQPQSPPSTNLGGGSAVSLQVQQSEAQPENKLEPGLTDEERAAVARLKERDREVRAHENAHASAGGGYAGAPSYEFTRGPDGVQYAVGGQVDIDVSEVAGDPRATIAKLEVVRSAALAPARPSGQDRAVAAAAAAKTQEARAELAAEEKEAREEAITSTEESQPEGPTSVSQAIATEVNPENTGADDFAQSGQPEAFSNNAFRAGTSQPTISIDLLV